MQKKREEHKHSDITSILSDIPKTEIHLHLEGLASVDTIWTLMNKHNLSVEGIGSKEDLTRRFAVKSLDEFISLFINVIQNCFQEESDLDLLMTDAQQYLKRNNIGYAEIFFAPSKFLLNGFSFKEIVQKLDSGAKLISKQDKREIRFIIDVSRSYGPENAMNNLDHTIGAKNPSIIGIGLGGSESQGPAEDYTAVFEKAMANGLHVVAHAGEDVGPSSIWNTLKYLKAERIGHGISAIQDKKLMEYLAERKIPLEICPTSNIFTRRYVSSYKDHPIRAFFDHGMLVTVNTDDPTIFGVELNKEYANLVDNDIFSCTEIVSILKNGLFATFMPKEQKDAFWKTMEAAITKTGLCQ
jgi:adenosine deaminase